MTDLMDPVDPLDEAKMELATNRIMSPEDLLGSLSPNAGLFFLQQAAYQIMAIWAAKLVDRVGDPEFESSELGRALQAIMTACGNLDEACVLVAILPPEALDEPDLEAEVFGT